MLWATQTLFKSMKKNIVFGKHVISEQSPVFCIGELSCNHLQNHDLALKTIDAMIASGVDCIKMQTFSPDKITVDCDKDDFVIKGGTLWDNRTLYSLYQEAYTPWEWFKDIKESVEAKGVEFLSSVNDIPAVDFLERLGVGAYKIPSFEITDMQLIDYIARTGKPFFIPTGVATKKDIDLAVETCLKAGNDKLVLMKCTSEYPAVFEDVNLRQMIQMGKDYDCLFGLSDHTMGSLVATSAVSLGARIVEKHFILERSLGGPDAAFSMEPAEYKMMVDNIRSVEKILGTSEYQMSAKQEKSRVFMRSLYVVKDVKKGEKVTNDNVASVRPGYGMHPKHLKDMLGKTFNSNVEKGTRFSADLVE